MLKSVFKWMFVVILTILLGSASALYIFKDRIIAQVIVEVNKYLAAPLDVRKIDIELFHGFPDVSVAFYDVVLPANSNKALLEADKLYFQFNFIAILKGEIQAEMLEVNDATIRLLIDKNNKSNFAELFKPPTEDSPEDSSRTNTNFRLNTIVLRNINLEYENLLTGTIENWRIDKLNGALSFDDNLLIAKVNGNVMMNKLVSRTWSSKQARDLDLQFNLSYNLESKLLAVSTSTLKHKGATFIIDGELLLNNEPKVNLAINGQEANFKLLTSFLPDKPAGLLKKYQSKGLIDFEAELKGQITAKKLPGLSLNLKLKDVDLTDKKYKANINDLNLYGKLRIADISDITSGSLNITSATGKLQGHPFAIDLKVSNFANPDYKLQFKGDIAVEWLLAAISFPNHSTGSGIINSDIIIAAKKNSKGEKVDSNISGSFKIDNASFRLSDTADIDRINGTIQLSGNAMNISDLEIDWLNSDITINGVIENILIDFAGKNTNVLLRSDVRSRNLDVEDILAVIRSSPELGGSSTFSQPAIDLDLTCVIDSLKFRKYKGKNVSGEIYYQENVIEVLNLNGEGLGGGIMVNGKIYVLTNKDFYIDTKVLTKNIYLDSLFYVFNNFDQSFITNNDLRGRLYADVSATMFFDSTWRFRRKLLKSEAKLRIVEGELHQFEPLMALSAYIDDRDDNLANLRFSDLVNYITIREDTVFIPEMSIQTNVRNIAIGGYHTLSQHINYQLAVPILVNERIDKDEAFGAIQKSSKGSPNLLFRIKGTTSDFKVNYDLMRATGNVLKLLDITKIFKKKEEEPVDSSFLNDEVFDW